MKFYKLTIIRRKRKFALIWGHVTSPSRYTNWCTANFIYNENLQKDFTITHAAHIYDCLPIYALETMSIKTPIPFERFKYIYLFKFNILTITEYFYFSFSSILLKVFQFSVRYFNVRF